MLGVLCVVIANCSVTWTMYGTWSLRNLTGCALKADSDSDCYARLKIDAKFVGTGAGDTPEELQHGTAKRGPAGTPARSLRRLKRLKTSRTTAGAESFF